MNNLPSLPIKRGEFVTDSVGNGSFTPPNAVGLVVTPPPGQRVRLTHLSVDVSGSEANITVAFGSTNVLTNVTIWGASATNGTYSIGKYQPYPVGQPPWGNHTYITGKTDEPLTITKVSPLSYTLYYSYEFGE